MLINRRCTVCHDDIDMNDSKTCGECGERVHRKCEPFERAFTCRRCADEPAIGAVEF